MTLCSLNYADMFSDEQLPPLPAIEGKVHHTENRVYYAVKKELYMYKILTAEKKIHKTTWYHRYLQDPEKRSSFLRDSNKSQAIVPDHSLLGDISPTHVVLPLLLDIAKLGVEWNHIVKTFQRHLVTSHLLAQQCQHVYKSTTEHTFRRPQ